MKVTGKYFDQNAKDYNLAYDKVRDLKSFIFNERKKMVLGMFDLKGGKVLDIGCGPGVYTDRLCESGFEAYGVDPSEEMIRIAKQKGFKNAKFFVGNAENLGFDDGYFDGALCVGVLEYLISIEDGIKEVARVTKPGGIAIFTGPNGSSLLNKFDSLSRGITKYGYDVLKIKALKSAIDHEYNSSLLCRAELDKILKRNGFMIEEWRFHLFRLSFLNKAFPRMALWIAKKMNFTSHPLLAINMIVKCKKI